MTAAGLFMGVYYNHTAQPTVSKYWRQQLDKNIFISSARLHIYRARYVIALRLSVIRDHQSKKVEVWIMQLFTTSNPIPLVSVI